MSAFDCPPPLGRLHFLRLLYFHPIDQNYQSIICTGEKTINPLYFISISTGVKRLILLLTIFFDFFRQRKQLCKNNSWKIRTRTSGEGWFEKFGRTWTGRGGGLKSEILADVLCRRPPESILNRPIGLKWI